VLTIEEDGVIMFSLRSALSTRQLPRNYTLDMGIVVLCGHRPTSITVLKNSPCPESFIVHFKSLVPLNDSTKQFIATQFTAMQRLYAEGGVASVRGTTEDLSGNAALQHLQNLKVGQCVLGQPTNDQNNLFVNRDNVGDKEVVVYVVSTLIGGAGNVVGCATHPDGQPGAAVIQIGANWLVAHEVGHVLGLSHVCEVPPTPGVPCVAANSDSLMFPTVGWTNVPPDLSDPEYSTMVNSDITNAC
jgi:hypothetical protein